MTKDKTVTMSRELLVRLNNLHVTGNDIDIEMAEVRALLAAPVVCICRGCFTEQPSGTACVTCAKVEAERAAPVVERQDGSALMKIAADLANRHPLRQLYLVCEHQGRINTDSLHEHLDKCGDLLAGISLDIRRAITSPPEPVAVVLPERREPTQDNPYLSDADHEWNACLDELKRLNPSL